MVSPEWSPNESYLAKLERLAFALVRTKKEAQCDIRRSRNLWVEKCKGLAGPFSLALLVAIPYIAENSSGPIIVASLLLAALDASLTVWCYTDFEGQHGHCKGDLFTCIFHHVGEFPAFLVGWWWIATMSAGFAAVARSLSAIMDSVTGRHVETLMENTLGSFTPLGAPIDIISAGVITVPSIMCSLGMEDSNFLRSVLFTLTSTTTLSIFGYALATNHLFPSTEQMPPLTPDGNLYAKIVSGAALACVGFLGLYTVCKPDNVTLTQHKHFHVSKRFSLTGCVVASISFLVYFIESTVINKVQQTPNVWDGDPPLLWPLEGGCRLIVASLGITALSLSTFEFLIPLSLTATKMANDGLLYRKLKKMPQDEPQQWCLWITPLVFGAISALQAMLIDTRVLLGLVSSSLMCIHIVVCCSMICARYQVRPCSIPSKKLGGHSQTRGHPNTLTTERARGSGTCVAGSSGSGGGGSSGRHSTRRLLAVSFLKNGLGKQVVHEIDVCRGGLESTSNANGNTATACLIRDADNVQPVEHTRRRESVSEFSLGSNVSGYESDTDQTHSEATDDTDIDAVVTEYQEEVATLNRALPTFTTGRRVAFSLIALVPCNLAMATSLGRSPTGQFTGVMLGISSGLLTFLLLVVISRQPQRRRLSKSKMPSPQRGSSSGASTTTPTASSSSAANTSGQESESNAGSVFFEYSLVPWVPAAAVLLHCCILLQGLDLAATAFAFWLAIGLIIYFSYSVSKSVAAPALIIPTEHIRLGVARRQSLLSSVVLNDPSMATTSTSASDQYAQIDTVLLA